VMGALRSAGSFRQVLAITSLDLALAKLILESLTLVLFALIVFGLLAFGGLAGRPHDLSMLIAAVLTIFAMAFGVGLVNGVLTRMFKPWALFYSIFARSMLFFSGVFYVPAQLPAELRWYLAFNPLLQGLEWFRLAWFAGYPAPDLDLGYLAGWAVVPLMLGLALDRAVGRRLAL